MEKGNQIRYVNAEGLDVHEADDGLVLFSSATDSVHHLNHTAGVIFELCNTPVSLKRLIAIVSELYGQAEEATAEAVEAGLNQLVKEGVVVEQHNI